jgi:hypothetical protein
MRATGPAVHASALDQSFHAQQAQVRVRKLAPDCRFPIRMVFY